MIDQAGLDQLDHPVAQHLLNTSPLAHLAYTSKNGTPRLIPVNFLWTGDELIIAAFAGSYKIKDLTARPDIAVCIDVLGPPPRVLMLRGKVTLEEVAGLLPEYATIQRALIGEDAAAGYLAAIDVPGLRMVKIVLRPDWVRVLDFQERFPERIPDSVLAAFTAGQ